MQRESPELIFNVNRKVANNPSVLFLCTGYNPLALRLLY